MPLTTTPSERIGRCTRMRRFFVRSSRSESFVHTRSSAGFTIITSGFEFSVHTACGNNPFPEIPRGVDFLFSLNRINVAISRAQVLSLVFASPRLLEVPCNNVEDMRLVNSLCALKEYGKQSWLTSPHARSPSEANTLNRRWADAKILLHVGFGRRPAVQARVEVDRQSEKSAQIVFIHIAWRSAMLANSTPRPALSARPIG